MQPFAFNTKFCQCNSAFIEFGHYADASLAMVVRDANTGEQLTKATISMAAYDEHPGDGYVFIKNYSENEGVVDALVEAGIIEKPERWLDAGYVERGVAECKLTLEVSVYE